MTGPTNTVSISTHPATRTSSNCQLLPSVSLVSLTEALGNRQGNSQAQVNQGFPAIAPSQPVSQKPEKGSATCLRSAFHSFCNPHSTFRISATLTLTLPPINSAAPPIPRRAVELSLPTNNLRHVAHSSPRVAHPLIVNSFKKFETVNSRQPCRSAIPPMVWRLPF